ncbi:MAG: amidohydrolase family protein [Pseudoxanthomonas suwonensis]|nr:amidohydrolase family protein [Pseudoxanthomonas suwonensis]
MQRTTHSGARQAPFLQGIALAMAGLLATLAPARTVQAQETAVAFTNARILPIAGAPIDNGTLVVRGGRIVAVGANVAIPAGATTIDASGKVIMPGLVDTHSHIGQVSGADSSGAIQADVRALDSVNARHAGINKARAGGITTVNVMPGSGHLLSGQTLFLKLRSGNTVEDLGIRLADGSLAGGIKMANGTNPMRREGPFPGTRAKSAAMAREAFVAARAYCRGTPKSRDLAKEGLCDVLSGKRVVHFHSHRHDDIMTAVRLSREFGFRVVLQHGTDAWMIANELAAAGVAVSSIMLDAPGGKLETMDFAMESGAVLERAGVLTAFHTDDPITDSRLLLRSAGLAVRAGMSRDEALRAMTINGAKMLDLDERIGSLEAGKDADFIVLDGDPLSVYTQVQQTWVEGRLVFDRSRPEDANWATGGWGAGRDAIARDVLMMEAGE